MGYEVISVDNDPNFSATHQGDILKWDYKKEIEPYHFDVIAASPPCTEHSTALTGRKRRLYQADQLVRKALEKIAYFQPPVWFMENPRHGLLRTRPFMKGQFYVDVDYCVFSDWGYKKPTRFWGSENIGKLPNQYCWKEKCSGTIMGPNGKLRHIGVLGAS